MRQKQDKKTISNTQNTEINLNECDNPNDIELNKQFINTSYRVKNGCLYRLKKDESGAENLIFLSNFVIYPEKEIIKDDGQDTTRFFRLAAYLYGNKLPNIADINSDKFSSLNFIIPTWGLKMRSSTAPNTLSCIRDATQSLCSFSNAYCIFVHTGWRKINNKYAFLHANGAVGTDNVSVSLEGRLSKYSLPTSGGLDQYKESANVVLDYLKLGPKKIIIPLISTVILAVLSEFERTAGQEPAFILFLLGRTGTFKSTLAALALNFFGPDFNNKTLPGSFRDTAGSLEKTGFLLKDVLMVIDDLYPSTDRIESQRMKQTLQTISRAYGDRTGRNRLNADATLKKSYIPRGMCIITGEDIPDIGQSGAARNLIIEISEGDIEESKLTEVQNRKDQLSMFTRGFIEWLIPQADRLPEWLKQSFEHYRQQAKSKNHKRLGEISAHIQTAYDIFTCYLKDLGVELDPSYSCSSIINELSESQQNFVEYEKPTDKFLNVLKELLATGMLHVKHVTEKNSCESGFVGYIDDEYYYFYPDLIFKEIKKFFDAQGTSFPLTQRSLYKELANDNLIFTKTEGNIVRTTPQKMINGRQQRFLHLKRRAIDIDLQDFKEKEYHQVSISEKKKMPWEVTQKK